MLQCTSGSSCNGGWPEDAIDRVKNGGIPLETAFPYQGNDNYYSNICSAGSLKKLGPTIVSNVY